MCKKHSTFYISVVKQFLIKASKSGTGFLILWESAEACGLFFQKMFSGIKQKTKITAGPRW
jgi:hypothetical protein